jgi:hypothetical protein
MNARIVFVAAVVLAAVACTSTNATSTANLNGAHDLVLVDQLQGDLLAAKSNNPDGGPYLVVGLPARYLYLTSTETNEVRVLETYVPGLLYRRFSRAPNPLETLSIPVLDRPTMLAADEGRNSEGSRVTGAYVYAARPGAAEVSVVSIANHVQLGGKPMATPAPVTAIGAYMNVDPTDQDPTTSAPENLLPATTRLFVATWDGEFAAVYAADLGTDSPNIDHLDFKRLVLIAQTPISAMFVVSPLSNRTLDGTPFCDTKPCLALATRQNAGAGGQAMLLDPETNRSAPLSFKGPVKYLTSSTNASRVYGILDEQACGGPACGGVVAVDVVTGTTAAGFPAALDAIGLPMLPLQSQGLITGLTLAEGGMVQQTVETTPTDGGTVDAFDYLQQQYSELGAFSSSNGLITFFSGLAGSVIDYDARRSIVGAAAVRLPGPLADGGEAFFGPDGGVIGSNTAATVVVQGDLSQTYRTATVTTTDGTEWNLDLSDGYLDTQLIAIVYQGGIPGLVGVATSAADGVHLLTGGWEPRAAVGDIVTFDRGDATDGYVECGRSRIVTIGAGFIEVAEAPATCADRVRFTVRADGQKPLVAAGDLESYMGRWAPGDTLTYNRPYVLLHAGVTAPRTALTITIPGEVPTKEGSFISFQILGRMAPLQVTIDTTSIGCYSTLTGQVVLGNLVMAQVPTPVGSLVDFRWTSFATVPSGNGAAEISLLGTRIGALGLNDGAYCWR